MSGIDHDLTPRPVCPECGKEVHDAWELNFGGMEGTFEEFDCNSCGCVFDIERSVDIRYSTTARGAA